MHTPLDAKKALYAAVAIFVVVSVWSYLVTRFVMWPLFESSAAAQPLSDNIWLLRLWRYLGRAVFSLAFVVIFARGYAGKPGVGEGVRYGLLVGALVSLTALFSSLGMHEHLRADNLITSCILDVFMMVIIGVIANKMYRPKEIKSAP